MNTVRLDSADDGIAVLTLDRPKRLNAITDELVEDAHAALSTVEADPEARVLVLTGAGRGFCSGADLQQSVAEGGPRALPTSTLYARQRRWSQLSLRLHELAVPVIAAVNGPAVGGGFALALAADLRIAADTAYFCAANVRIGLTGGEMGLTWLLTRTVGAALTAELLLTARNCDAAEALSRGLVSRVVAGPDLLPAALELARLIRANPAFGIALTKEMLRVAPHEATLRQALVLEDRSQSLSVHSGDVDRASTEFDGRRRDG
ncbi:MAG TPA: enoyl-CoA hydratase/isomerase family protein [Jatrophihabitantaceae bacterium]